MRHGHAFAWRLMCAVALCTLAPIPAWAQKADEAFKRGMDARGDQKWQEMAAAMLEAIKIDRQEATRRIQTRGSILGIGGASTEYFPHYFLGEALKNQKDCAGAITAWEESQEQGVVRSNAEFSRNIEAGYKECAAQGVLLRDDYRRQTNDVGEEYKEALGALTRVENLRQSNPDLWRAESDAALERARKAVTAAFERLKSARTSRQAREFGAALAEATAAKAALEPIESGLRKALNDLVAVRGQRTGVLQQIDTAEGTDRAIAATKFRLTESMRDARDEGVQALERARDKLAEAERTRNPAAAADAEQLAVNATSALAKVLEEVRSALRAQLARQLEAAISAAEQEFSFLDASLARLGELFTQRATLVQPPMVAAREQLDKDLAGVRRRFETARRADDVSGIQEVTRTAAAARMKLDALINAFGPATLRDRGVVQALEDAQRYFADGQYEQVIGALGPRGSMSDVPLQIHVRLFRAAALYAMYLRSGGTNTQFRDDAQAEIQHCKELDPAFQPSTRMFSPRFLRFYESVGALDTEVAAVPEPPL